MEYGEKIEQFSLEQRPLAAVIVVEADDIQSLYGEALFFRPGPRV